MTQQILRIDASMRKNGSYSRSLIDSSGIGQDEEKVITKAYVAIDDI